MLLYDGGFRAGELLNVRLADVTFRKASDGIETCFVRIRVSKTRPRTISLPLATETVRFWINRHPSGGPIGPEGEVQAKNATALLITWQYDNCRKRLREVGKSELGEHLYFHRFRHASATFYAKRLTSYQLCARFGWAMGSSVVERYIDHSGVLAEEVASTVRLESPALETHGSVQPAGPDAEVRSLIAKLRQNPQLIEALRAALQ